MKALLMIIVSLVWIGSGSAVFAEGNGTLMSLITDYADLKERVQDVREARKSGYAADSVLLMGLYAEISTAKQDTFQFRADQHKSGTTGKTDETTTWIIYAYEAMAQMIFAEIDHNLYLPHSDTGLRLADKYEEIWRMIDSSIPVVSFTS